MTQNTEKNKIIAVIGDVHHHVWLAVEELSRIEVNLGNEINQVFSVGDFGLFLGLEDWDFLTGPDRYRCEEDTPKIVEAWAKWRWPLSMIGGNHEPFNRLRDWNPDYYGHRLSYVDAGALEHSIEGLTAYGLTGIRSSDFDQKGRSESWSEVLESVQKGERNKKDLVYYSKRDFKKLLGLKKCPHILLTHDWPIDPKYGHSTDFRPEFQIMSQLEPLYHFSGHKHEHVTEQIGPTRFEGLNIISKNGNVNEDWCRLLVWDGRSLDLLT